MPIKLLSEMVPGEESPVLVDGQIYTVGAEPLHCRTPCFRLTCSVQKDLQGCITPPGSLLVKVANQDIITTERKLEE